MVASKRTKLLILGVVLGVAFGASAIAATATLFVRYAALTRVPTYTVVHTFAPYRPDRSTPASLTIDDRGSLHGVARWDDIVFSIKPPAAAGSPGDLRVLLKPDAMTAGSFPGWSAIDRTGALYVATTSGGGADGRGGGTLFALRRAGDGWGAPEVLFTFPSRCPVNTMSDLISDGSGAFYGTTQGCGGPDGGTVFKLSKTENHWAMTILHRFKAAGDGAYPHAGLVMDAAGVLYGTTGGGGKDEIGTVFKLTPSNDGWHEEVIHTFRQLDGSQCRGGCLPMAGLTLGPDGTLYGTTGAGGNFGEGVVFALTPSGDGGWRQRVLYSFRREDGDGSAPNSRLVLGPSGELYGTTRNGGDQPSHSGKGTVFKLIPSAWEWLGLAPATSEWTEIVVHRFAGDADGGTPTANLVRDGAGRLFGITEGGAYSGVSYGGTVYAITP
jgi:uncharacterized repeat protein (TIGR03803 family)